MPDEESVQLNEQNNLDRKEKLEIEKLELEVKELRLSLWKRKEAVAFYSAFIAAVFLVLSAIITNILTERSRQRDVAKEAINRFIDRQIERMRDINTRESAAMLLKDQIDAYEILCDKYQQSKDDSLRAGIVFALPYLNIGVEVKPLARKARCDKNPRVAHYGYLTYLSIGDTALVDSFLNEQILKKKIIYTDDREMVLIPAGSFWMGDEEGEFDEKPKHLVYVDAFYIDRYEVTNSNYKAFCDATGPVYPPDINFEDMPDYFLNYPDHPVVNVTWEDAYAYAQWAGIRLPTEAEWEKAARGGLVSKDYAWGDTLDPNKANYDGTNIKDRWVVTAPVGSFDANGYSLFDMVGNVKEWVTDWYMETYYRISPSENPKAPKEGLFRVIRGGSYYDFLLHLLRYAHRFSARPNVFHKNLGFRCAKNYH